MKYILSFILFSLCIIQLQGLSNIKGTRTSKSTSHSKPIKSSEPTKTTKVPSKPSLPLKTTKKDSKSKKISDYVKSKVGSGYVWGSTGQILDEKLYKRLKARHVGRISDRTNKWKGKQVFDSAGLVKKSLEQAGIKVANGATSSWKNTKWKEKGELSNLPKDKVCILYKKGPNGTMTHSGIYTGDGYVIHAKNEDSGVVREKISDSWTNWAYADGM